MLRVNCPAMCLKWSAKAWRDAFCAECHVLRDALIASKRASTGFSKRASTGFSLILVGASLLAMVVNDNACGLDKRDALESIVGTPPGAGSLLQVWRYIPL